MKLRVMMSSYSSYGDPWTGDCFVRAVDVERDLEIGPQLTILPRGAPLIRRKSRKPRCAMSVTRHVYYGANGQHSSSVIAA